MGKSLYIAEKPSVAQEFARVLGLSASRRDGYLEGEDSLPLLYLYFQLLRLLQKTFLF